MKPGPRCRKRTLLPESIIAASRLKPSLLASVDQEDDRENIQPGDPVVLIVEDDSTYSRFLLDAAHEMNFKAVMATRGDMGLALARKFRPSKCLLAAE